MMNVFVVIGVCTFWLFMLFGILVFLRRRIRGRKRLFLVCLTIYLVMTAILFFVLFPQRLTQIDAAKTLPEAVLVVLCSALLTWVGSVLERNVPNKKKRFWVGLAGGLVLGLLYGGLSWAIS